MEKIISLCKRRGFIFQGSEIYGGLTGTWDYGPYGIELKNNIKNLWWRMFVQGRDDMVGLDAAILMNPRAWEASGHVSGFSDPLVDCKKCGTRQRADVLMEDKKSLFQEKVNEYMNEDVTYSRSKKTAFIESSGIPYERTDVARKAITEYIGPLAQRFLNEHINCPACNSRAWGEPHKFNMMFKTSIGAIDDGSSISYLRPETAGGIFVNFKNVVDSVHPKMPFGIGQIGKAFRNEIAPRDFIFRVRELEQMEIEYFVKPSDWEGSFEEWRQEVHHFIDAVGIDEKAVHELEVAPEDRAHYSKRTIDFEFDFPFGRKELFGLAYRTDFDLSAHAGASGVKLEMQGEEGEKPYTPHVIEPSFGVDRTVLAVLASVYTEDELGGEPRTYLKFNKAVAPIKAAVFPLLKNKPELVAKAREVYTMLKQEVPQIMWDDNGNIGKRYRRQDEIGTPVCITIDFDTLGETADFKDTVTVRDRDTGEQQRVKIEDLTNIIN
ncbi:glycine--tRNA ligase [Candidatus Kaiserbacteria bacterium]|nr:glycine--tRNA ligase [Candidatus Kaiserbacteria bacterium]